MWNMGIGWWRLLNIWEFIMRPSAGLSGGRKNSIPGMQGCSIARPDPKPQLYIWVPSLSISSIKHSFAAAGRKTGIADSRFYDRQPGPRETLDQARDIIFLSLAIVHWLVYYLRFQIFEDATFNGLRFLVILGSAKIPCRPIF
jgi:hypothetical protein